MQNSLTFLLMFVVWSSFAAVAQAANTWALLVGVSKYQNDKLISSLRFPAADATSIHDAMVDPQLGGLPKGNVRLLTDNQATSTGILGAVDDYLKPNVKAGDRVVVFLAGHGIAKGVGTAAKGFFLSTDTSGLTTAALEASAVPLRTLSEKLGQLPAAQFLLFVDACREDPTPGRGLKGNQLTDVLSRGIQVVPQDEQNPATVATFFACSVGQRAFEDPDLKHGVFTYWILEGLGKGPVPAPPKGAVDLGVLAGYVTNKVGEWANQTFGGGRGATLATSGDDEVETTRQTPEMIAVNPQPIILMQVKRKLSGAPLAAPDPQVLVSAPVEGANVFLNGQKIGAAPIMATLKAGVESKIRVEAPGYEPKEQTVTGLPGYTFEVPVTLSPTARGVGAPANSPAAELYARSLKAEANQQWEIALAGYDSALQADAKFGPAYENLADLQRRRGARTEAVATLMRMINQVPNAHSYSLLSRAYSSVAEAEMIAKSPQGQDEGEEEPAKGGALGGLGGLFGKKKKKKQPKAAPPSNAVVMALRAAGLAIKADPNAAEAYRARGFALAVADVNGQNQTQALQDFGKAAFLDDKDAANLYALGFGIRVFALKTKKDEAQKAELRRAVTTLKDALKLRPDYYEAHRELAYCYHLLNETAAAMHEYEMANANRGAATDADEVAGSDIALASLHQQQAQTATNANEKKGHEDASAGYVGDAQETSPNLERALSILGRVSLGSRVLGGLPSGLQDVLDPAGMIRRRMPSLPGSLPLPGGFRFPGL